MTKKIKLSVIIVNFNTDRFLIDCIKSIYKSILISHNFEIIVVDNASSNFPQKEIEHKYPQIRIIRNSNNYGFAKANNIGIQNAHGDYILLLNPDTILSADTLVKMIDYMDNNLRVGLATCKVELASGELDDACHRGFPTPLNALFHFSGLSSLFPNSKIFNGYHLGYQNMDKSHEIDSCAGAFMIIRRQAGKEVNWLDEEYFWYGEDIDLCYRVKQNGWKIIFHPITTIKHYKGVSAGIKKHSRNLSVADKETQMMATKARFEAMKIFYQKHYQEKYPYWLRRLVILGITLKQFISLIQYK